jgi:hypothetical protein
LKPERWGINVGSREEPEKKRHLTRKNKNIIITIIIEPVALTSHPYSDFH